MTIKEYYDRYIAEVDLTVSSALSLSQILEEYHFSIRADRIENNGVEQYEVLRTYKHSAAIIFLLTKSLLKVNKLLECAVEFDSIEAVKQ
ncbi:MAG: hypothetical protein LBL82_02220 [Oscillospiraceae bacterium]|jgi:hypothetical protein|nr:hypothetical protein [Oscillospiraceae bacterium]